MDDDYTRLTRTAKQLIIIDELFGGQFIPAGHHPLPELDLPEPARAAGATMCSDEQVAALALLDSEAVKPCTRCVLSQSRTNTVFGEGNPSADLVFVGEGPGADEDRTGRPFVGRAGELLTKMITAMGLTRDDIFICNIVKCRPPGNRAPTPEEVESCWGYLMQQLQIIAPKVVVTLGNPATQNLLRTRVGITRLRGTWQKLPDLAEGLEGIDVMPTFHPAYLLRQYTPDHRGKVWSDLQAVMNVLGLAVPKKT